jgi:hypothetical protein
MTNCHERREPIFLYAAGVLEEAERSELEEHLASGCPRCNEALEEEREGLATLALSLAPVVPPPRVRERLLARVREQAFAGARNGARPAPRLPRLALRGPRLGVLAAALFAVAALGLGIAWWGELRPADEAGATTALELDSLREQLADQDHELAELEARVETAGEIAKLLGARELEVLELAAAEPGSEAFGRAFWDPDYRCYFRAEGLPPLANGQSYVLWMIGAEERVHAAGELAPDAHGNAVLYTRLPRELSPIAKSFVTAEAVPYGDRPGGPVLLLGEAPRSR